jgi:choline monooxygenase
MADPELVDADVRRARTLPLEVYRDSATYERLRRTLLPRTWHFLDVPALDREGVAPVTFLEGSLDEPLLFARDGAGATRLLSNVCTHRNAILVNAPCAASHGIRCPYHGRRFRLDGRFASMPAFEEALDFPSADDDLPEVATASLGPMSFAALSPTRSFDAALGAVRARLGGLPIDDARIDDEGSRSYDVDASWLLYVDNYLEGFHVPFVHPALHAGLDLASYRTELFDDGVLQVGVGRAGEPTLPIAEANVAALYFWLFPATMINVYPWGVSLNAVRPRGVDRARVVYRTYVFPGVDPASRRAGAGGDLHTVELEDEAVVASVQRGARAYLARRGRFSPSREAGVHHFHRTLARWLDDEA